MIRSSGGFIILSVLILLYFFSLLSIYEINLVATKTKYNRQRIEEEVYFDLATVALKVVEDSIPSCLIEKISANELKKLPLNWWQAFACGGKVGKFQYYFVQELLDKDPCGFIQNSNSMIAVYYRVTLIFLSERGEISKKQLQSTVVKAETPSSSCMDKIHTVTIGRQLLREI